MRNPEDRHPFFDQIEKLFKNKTGLAGFIIITSLRQPLLAPVISPHDRIENALYDQLKPLCGRREGPLRTGSAPTTSARHPVQAHYGARVSLTLGVVSVGLALTLGTLLGALAGYYKGWLDNLIMRFMDIILAFPHILLAIVIVAYLGPGLRNAMMAIGIINIPRFARIVRASVMDEFEKDYVTAARAVGAKDGRVIFNAILPNCLAPMIVQASLFWRCHPGCGGAELPGTGCTTSSLEWGP
jgi:peptide/nickel transport system permease protein/dipeptide transport system permease protein